MNERQWEIVMLFMENTLRVLEEIRDSVANENVEEKQPKITGFEGRP